MPKDSARVFAERCGARKPAEVRKATPGKTKEIEARAELQIPGKDVSEAMTALEILEELALISSHWGSKTPKIAREWSLPVKGWPRRDFIVGKGRRHAGVTVPFCGFEVKKGDVRGEDCLVVRVVRKCVQLYRMLKLSSICGKVC